ncbi:MAG: ANTAR domain-containing response regulator [Phycisphaerales bacterium]
MNSPSKDGIPTTFGPARIMVADDEHLVALGIASSVRDLGHEVVGTAPDGEAAVTMARQLLPDLALLDLRMPKLSGTEVAMIIYEELAIPSLVISAYSDQEYVSKIQAYGESSGVFAYLLKPVGVDELRVSIGVARHRAASDAHHIKRIEQLERNLVNRRIVEQAKWKLVETTNMTEPAAHEKLQKMARDCRRPLVEIAKQILEGGEIKAS